MAPTAEQALNEQNTIQPERVGQSVGTSAVTQAAREGSVSLSGLTPALQAAFVLYLAFQGYKGVQGLRHIRRQAGSAPTDSEIFAASDLGGVRRLMDKYLPKEVNNAIPKEDGSVVNSLLFDAYTPFKAVFGSGKEEGQLIRDRGRHALEQAGFAEVIDGSHFVTLADGSKFNIGIDGNNTTALFDPTATIDDTGVGTKRPYDVDASNPLAQQAVGFVNPLSFMFMGGDDNLSANFAGYFSDAVLSNANGDIETARANAQAMYNQAFGQAAEAATQELGRPVSVEEVAIGILDQMFEAGSITEAEKLALQNGVRQVYGNAELTPEGTEIERDPNNPDVYTVNGNVVDYTQEKPHENAAPEYKPEEAIDTTPGFDPNNPLANAIPEPTQEPAIPGAKIFSDDPTDIKPTSPSIVPILPSSSTPDSGQPSTDRGGSPSIPAPQSGPPIITGLPDNVDTTGLNLKTEAATEAPAPSQAEALNAYLSEVQASQEAAKAEAEQAAREAQQRSLALSMLKQGPAAQVVNQALQPAIQPLQSQENQDFNNLAYLLGNV